MKNYECRMKKSERTMAIPAIAAHAIVILHSKFFISVFLAEEVGFEPTVPVTRDGGFQDRCLKPLDHSSGRDGSNESWPG